VGEAHRREATAARSRAEGGVSEVEFSSTS
jgi:hypothetical protein